MDEVETLFSTNSHESTDRCDSRMPAKPPPTPALPCLSTTDPISLLASPAILAVKVELLRDTIFTSRVKMPAPVVVSPKTLLSSMMELLIVRRNELEMAQMAPPAASPSVRRTDENTLLPRKTPLLHTELDTLLSTSAPPQHSVKAGCVGLAWACSMQQIISIQQKPHIALRIKYQVVRKDNVFHLHIPTGQKRHSTADRLRAILYPVLMNSTASRTEKRMPR